MVRACVYTRRGRPAKVLSMVNDYTNPILEENQIRIKVKAIALNPVDWKLMSYLPTILFRRPAVAACDYSGTIIESNNSRFVRGDEVYGMIHPRLKITKGLGSAADEIIAPAHTCAKRPETIDHIQAAGITLSSLTAIVLSQHAAISTKAVGRVTSSQACVLVCGGGSSVGFQLISILRHKGYRVAVTCSAATEGLVVERGASFMFDYKQDKMEKTIVEHTQKEGKFVAVLDCVEDFNVWQTSDQILLPRGHYVNIGMDLTNGLLHVVRRCFSYYLLPAWLGGVASPYMRAGEIATEENMEEVRSLVENGVIRPVVDSVFDLESIRIAFEYLMNNHTQGKIVVQM